ncbi:MAG TPA: DUF1735 domain-containing protein [Puia sp.]|nr:DUF1735 domain-containing protein [Puia sp.]
MKIKILIPAAFLIVIMMASCLKDTPYMDVSNTAPIIEFGQSPAQGVSGPFIYAGDSTAMVDTAVALVLASPQVEPDTLQTLVSVDPTQVTSYNSNNGTNFSVLPDSLFTISDTVNILPGYRVGNIQVTLKFPGLHNYALPLKISASYFLNNNQQVIVSSNSGTFMWLFP